MEIRLRMSSKSKKRMPRWLDVTLRVIEWTLILFIVGCMLVLLSQKITGNTPELFGYSSYTIVTNSMKGTYDVGDVVICKRIKNTLEYQEQTGFQNGEVIAFIAPHGFDDGDKLQGQTVTHRILGSPFYDEETESWFVWTKGDAAVTRDRVPIPIENIQGIIVGNTKAIASLMHFLTKWYGFVTVIVIPLFAILVWQIVILVREKSRKEIEELEKEQAKTIMQIESDNTQKIEEIKKQAIAEYKNNLESDKNKEN